jgi:hypothetical protein
MKNFFPNEGNIIHVKETAIELIRDRLDATMKHISMVEKEDGMLKETANAS